MVAAIDVCGEGVWSTLPVGLFELSGERKESKKSSKEISLFVGRGVVGVEGVGVHVPSHCACFDTGCASTIPLLGPIFINSIFLVLCKARLPFL